MPDTARTAAASGLPDATRRPLLAAAPALDIVAVLALAFEPESEVKDDDRRRG